MKLNNVLMKVVPNPMLKNRVYFYILAIIILFFLYSNVNKEAAAVFIFTSLVMMYQCKCSLHILFTACIVTAFYIVIFKWNERILEGATTIQNASSSEKNKKNNK
jgi:hypothetical protein